MSLRAGFYSLVVVTLAGIIAVQSAYAQEQVHDIKATENSQVTDSLSSEDINQLMMAGAGTVSVPAVKGTPAPVSQDLPCWWTGEPCRPQVFSGAHNE